jgi:hypothetical protein
LRRQEPLGRHQAKEFVEHVAHDNKIRRFSEPEA